MRDFLLGLVLLSLLSLRVSGFLPHLPGATSWKSGVRSSVAAQINGKLYRRNDVLLRASNHADEFDLELNSPCKLNLFLRILGQQPGGYHELASLFQAISLSDRMLFSKLSKEATKDIMTCSDPSLAVDDNNLVIKALQLMRQKTGIQQYFRVHLDKKVPMQAGLGGGSSNAATAMHAFNSLFEFAYSNDQLKLWSADIGSDVTFFFSSGTAYCTGRGEIVKSLDILPHAETVKIHIFKPDEGLSTALVFENLDLNTLNEDEPETLLQSFTANGVTTAATMGSLVNDLEKPAFLCNPSLLALKKDIQAYDEFPHVMMSGSGTSIYAIGKASDSQQDDDSLSTAVDAIKAKYAKKLHYFSCDFVGKLDAADAWYGGGL